MSHTPAKIKPRARSLALLSLFVVLLALLNRGAQAAPIAVKKIPELCGRLVFLSDVKTGLKTIGLEPCNGAKPYIFHAGPRELLNYYKFWNVKTQVGQEIIDPKFGKLDTYIIDFETYIPLNHCGDCGKDFVPTYTPRATATLEPGQPTATGGPITPSPTFPPTPTFWSTSTSSPAPATHTTGPNLTDTPTGTPTNTAPPTSASNTPTEVAVPIEVSPPRSGFNLCPGAFGAPIALMAIPILRWRRRLKKPI